MHNSALALHSTEIAGLLFFNAGSLCGKVAYLHYFIYSRSIVPSVIGIFKTWFNHNIPDECLNLPDFTVLRFDRPTHGGGIMLFLVSHFKLFNYILVPNDFRSYSSSLLRY